MQGCPCSLAGRRALQQESWAEHGSEVTCLTPLSPGNRASLAATSVIFYTYIMNLAHPGLQKGYKMDSGPSMLGPGGQNGALLG